MVPYNRNREFYKFRWFYDYSGSQLTDYGVHNVDMLRWCLGQNSPVSVAAIGACPKSGCGPCIVSVR
jgi:predicted dehydrogenase